jgi:hypothetical protein
VGSFCKINFPSPLGYDRSLGPREDTSTSLQHPEALGTAAASRGVHCLSGRLLSVGACNYLCAIPRLPCSLDALEIFESTGKRTVHRCCIAPHPINGRVEERVIA